MNEMSPINRVAAIDWPAVSAELDTQGWGIMPKLMAGAECDAVVELYDQDSAFRSRVVMARHGYGRGEYRYFAYPLPRLVEALRTALYPNLVPIANRWHERMRMDVRFPADHAAFIERCHQPVRPARRRCYCSMARTTITACIKTCMANTCSRFRSRCCCPSQGTISKVASSC